MCSYEQLARLIAIPVACVLFLAIGAYMGGLEMRKAQAVGALSAQLVAQ